MSGTIGEQIAATRNNDQYRADVFRSAGIFFDDIALSFVGTALQQGYICADPAVWGDAPSVLMDLGHQAHNVARSDPGLRQLLHVTAKHR
jgi:hypothetical protein